MGLFDIFKKRTEEKQPEKTKKNIRKPDPDEIFEVGEAKTKVYFPKDGDEPNWEIEVYINLTENAVKVKVPERKENEGNNGVNLYQTEKVYIWQEENSLIGKQGEKVIFAVTKRSNAYKELLKCARQKATRVSIWQEHYENRTYYRAKLCFPVVVILE